MSKLLQPIKISNKNTTIYVILKSGFVLEMKK